MVLDTWTLRVPQSKGCRKRQQSRGGDHLGLSAAGLHPNRKQVLLTPEPQSLSESGPGGPRMSQLQTFPLDKDAQVPFQITRARWKNLGAAFALKRCPPSTWEVAASQAKQAFLPGLNPFSEPTSIRTVSPKAQRSYKTLQGPNILIELNPSNTSHETMIPRKNQEAVLAAPAKQAGTPRRVP